MGPMGVGPMEQHWKFIQHKKNNAKHTLIFLKLGKNNFSP